MPPMALTAAEKVKRHRARHRAGEAVLPIQVNLNRVADWLVDQHQLAEWDADDREKIRAALEQAIGFWSRYETV